MAASIRLKFRLSSVSYSTILTATSHYFLASKAFNTLPNPPFPNSFFLLAYID